jgi:hypothetical protein
VNKGAGGATVGDAAAGLPAQAVQQQAQDTTPQLAAADGIDAAPAQAEASGGEARISKRLFSKPHAVETMARFGSHLAIRLWAVDATEFIRIILRVGGITSNQTRVTTLFYARKDIEPRAPGAVGLTILLRDPALLEAGMVEVLLVSVRDEILVARKPIVPNSYSDFFAGIVYDIQRTGRQIEQRLLFDRSRGLSDLIQSSWNEYLAEQKSAYLSFGKAYRPSTFSVITVFYRKPFIASLYAFTARILDLPPGAEVILGFQQGALFQQQIDYLESLFRMFQINHKFILFEDNIGFAAANNVAAEQATSPRLLLVNPDICCNDPTIYSKLAAASDDGNLYGATLLSDADEVMHNGIELLDQTIAYKNKAQRVLRTSHIGRHMPVALIEEGAITEVGAVSGALIAISAATWEKLGGLPEHFVFAHFEDVEFCRIAKRAGVAVRVYNTRELIHLESYGSGEDSLLNAIKQVNSAIFNMGAR